MQFKLMARFSRPAPHVAGLWFRLMPVPARKPEVEEKLDKDWLCVMRTVGSAGVRHASPR